MDTINQIINQVTSVPPEFWQFLFVVLGVSALLQKFKKWFSLQSEKVITATLGLLSFVPVAIGYISAEVATNPAYLGPYTLTIMGGATVAYRFVIKPLTNILLDAKAERQRRLQTEPAPTEPAPAPAVEQAPQEFNI